MKLDEFIMKHGKKRFPHSDELLPAILNGTCTMHPAAGVSDAGVSTPDLLHTYTRRAAHLAQYSSPHARALRKDTMDLCTRLGQTKDGTCHMHTFTFSNGRIITVFEGDPSGDILGAFKAVDKRMVTDKEWSELWGEQSPPPYGSPAAGSPSGEA